MPDRTSYVGGCSWSTGPGWTKEKEKEDGRDQGRPRTKRTTDMTDSGKITRDVEARVESVRYTIKKKNNT